MSQKKSSLPKSDTKKTTKDSKSENHQDSSQEDTKQDDSALIDISQHHSLKKLFSLSKKRGYVKIDDINKNLPSTKFGTEQIEDFMAQLSEAGINIVDEQQESPEEENQTVDVEITESSFNNVSAVEGSKTDDPVRMYLREMGVVELLTREGEIAIAKRIEAGHYKMIGALCESPITMNAIIKWA